MDSKNRLVLPLEIRNELGLEKFDSISLSVSKSGKDMKLKLGLAEGTENIKKYSKNGGVLDVV
ncbi:MAG: hypothetical protein WC501_05595 [Candidatus Micrarchaeia archaeon]